MARRYQDMRNADPTAVIIKELRQATRQNTQQIADVAATVRQLADVETRNSEKLGEFIAAVKVLSTIVEQHGGDIDTLKQHEEQRQQAKDDAQKQAQQNRFTLKMNAVGWTFTAISCFFGLMGFLNFLSQHWK